MEGWDNHSPGGSFPDRWIIVAGEFMEDYPRVWFDIYERLWYIFTRSLSPGLCEGRAGGGWVERTGGRQQ